MKRIFLFVMISGILINVSAQTLSPKVIPTQGNVYSSGGYSLSWTTGETFTPTLSSVNYKLTQGFQQPELQVIANAITGSPFCAGSAINVPYIAQGIFRSNNLFTAQLSNASGSFTSPVTIGTITGYSNGTISCVIPTNTPSGMAYRIRVISNSPVFIGKDDGTDITITSLPTFTTVVTDNSSCTTAHTASIAVTASGGTGTKIYSDNGGNSYQGASLFSALANGTYTVKVKDADGCLSNTSSIVITSNSGVTFTSTIVNATTCNAPNGKITVLATGGDGFYNYSKDGGTTFQSSNIFTSLLHGTYSIKVKDAVSCMSPIAIATVGPTCQTRLEGNGVPSLVYAFHVYPNPTNDRVTVAFTAGNEESYTISVMDITGRIIQSLNYTSVIGENQFQMDLSQVAKGIYMVILQNKDAVLQSKIVVQ